MSEELKATYLNRLRMFNHSDIVYRSPLARNAVELFALEKIEITECHDMITQAHLLEIQIAAEVEKEKYCTAVKFVVTSPDKTSKLAHSDS